MRVANVMSPNPACCKEDTSLYEVARMMAEHDCGAVPVVDSRASMQLRGMVTDRDLALRPLCERRHARDVTAGDYMTRDPLRVTPEMSVEQCSSLMAERKVRRVPVVNAENRCCGIVSVADLVQVTSATDMIALLRKVTTT